MKDYEYLRLTMESARDDRVGKPLANNTRLFRGSAVVDGKTVDAFIVRYHRTEIVKVLADGRAILANGGWNTTTTMERIRRYGSQHVYSEGGDWYVQLAPSKDDPRPACVHRTIPKPYDEPTDPGPAPVKTLDGAIIYGDQHIQFPNKGKCLVGQTHTLEYQYERMMVLDSDQPQQGEVIVKHGDSRYRYARGWGVETITYTERSTYRGGEQQCPHCKAFQALEQRWYWMEHGTWGRGSKPGHKTWREMMERFGTVEAWQEAYIADFRARREYLKLEREWIDRNRVPFFDGIIVDAEGYAIRPPKALTKKLEAHERKVERIHKKIEKYVNGYVDALKKGMPMPTGGDCWYCSMSTVDEHTGKTVPLGDAMQTLHPDGRLTVEPSHGHLNDHMREGYYVPSLAVNALRESGYKDVGIAIHLNMSPETRKMGGDRASYDLIRRDLKRYMRKRLIPNAPIK